MEFCLFIILSSTLAIDMDTALLSFVHHLLREPDMMFSFLVTF